VVTSEPTPYTAQQIANENFFTTRVDHSISTKDGLAGTYVFDNAPQTTHPIMLAVRYQHDRSTGRAATHDWDARDIQFALKVIF
jgi:hypothetical protein